MGKKGMGGFSCKYSILIWNLSYVELSSQGKKKKSFVFGKFGMKLGMSTELGQFLVCKAGFFCCSTEEEVKFCWS